MKRITLTYGDGDAKKEAPCWLALLIAAVPAIITGVFSNLDRLSEWALPALSSRDRYAVGPER